MLPSQIHLKVAIKGPTSAIHDEAVPTKGVSFIIIIMNKET